MANVFLGRIKYSDKLLQPFSNLSEHFDELMNYIDMDIQVTPVNFNASQDLIRHMKDYFKKLTKYNDQITSMDVFMESISDEKDDKLVKLKILAPGHELYLQSNKGDFVTAAQDVYDRMKRQLIDQKEIDKENHQNRPDKVY